MFCDSVKSRLFVCSYIYLVIEFPALKHNMTYHHTPSEYIYQCDKIHLKWKRTFLFTPQTIGGGGAIPEPSTRGQSRSLTSGISCMQMENTNTISDWKEIIQNCTLWKSVRSRKWWLMEDNIVHVWPVLCLQFSLESCTDSSVPVTNRAVSNGNQGRRSGPACRLMGAKQSRALFTFF